MEKVPSPNSGQRLTVEGQRVFWDRQADTYENAALTENGDELLEVAARISIIDFDTSGVDVVVFGGAVGSRDPGVVVDSLIVRNIQPEKIYFNDLSPSLANRADQGPLANYRRAGIQTAVMPGRIVDIGQKIPKRSRVIFFGAYRADALVRVGKNDGIDDYLRNPDLVGEKLTLQLFSIDKGEYKPKGAVEALDVDSKNIEEVRARLLAQIEKDPDRPAAVRVVGTSSNRAGFFLSHWFTEAGLREVATEAFGNTAGAVVQLKECHKCWVVEVSDPDNKPSGVITMLNNVIGNVLPEEQLATLQAIGKVGCILP